MRIGIALLLFLTAALQYKVWFSDVGYLAGARLQSEVDKQRQRTAVLRERNRNLTAEVMALTEGLEAVESRARSDLGMIERGETFYLVPDLP